MKRFRELHRLSLVKHATFAEMYNDYLRTGLSLLDMEMGIISHIEDERYTVAAVQPAGAGIRKGERFELGETYCSWVVEKGESVAIEHVGGSEAGRQHPVYLGTSLESYLAAPIWVDGQIFGTLNFTATTIREKEFGKDDRELIELMAKGLGYALERDRLERLHEEARRRMQENMELFESAFEYAPIGIALVAPSGRWLRVNKSLSDMVGYTQDELLTLDFQTITHPDDLDADLALVQELLEGKRETYRMEKRYFHRAGHTVWILLSVSAVRHDNGDVRYFVSQIQDVSDQKQALTALKRQQTALETANLRLEQLAIKDPLTHVFNRRAFNERIEQAWAQASRAGSCLSLLLLDVDHFKSYNDKFGHPEGDIALQTLADVLMATSRISDVVARFGGEEFAVILPDTDPEGCLRAAERIRAGVAAISSLQRPVTVSIGAVSARGELPPVDKMLRRADEALYRAKQLGRNRVEAAAIASDPASLLQSQGA